MSNKKWKLKLDFIDGLPKLEEEVNRVYYNYEVMCQVIDFYTSSDLLKSNKVEIEVLN